MECTLNEWLHSQPLPEDIMPLPWDSSVSYIPIDVVRNKLRIMEEKFGMVVTQTDVNVSAINTWDKDICFMATVKFTLKHTDFPGGVKRLCGAASFFAGQYKGGWAFSQIAESLATTRAFSKEWEQFGKGLNVREDIVSSLSAPKIKPDNKIAATIKQVVK